MKAPQANLLNATVLVAAGIIGYFFTPTLDGAKAPTALIPVAFGLLFFVLHKGVATSNKIVAHIVVVLTAVLLFICVSRFFKIEEWGQKKYIFLACIVSNIIALIAFIGSFIEARKNRQA
jgi:uncharacterized membrane protein (UPF0136 family)